MAKTRFPWEELKWEDFESLSLRLAQDIFQNRLFQKYLEQGAPQDGIDFFGSDPETGRLIYGQSKHEKLSQRKIDAAIKLFADKKFSQAGSTFILSTTSNLNTTELQNFLAQKKQALRQEKDIELLVWDVNFLEQELRKDYRTVHFFFGKNVADTYCQPPPPQPVRYQPYPDYIDRSLLDIRNKSDVSTWYDQDPVPATQTLLHLFSEQPLERKHLCIIAEAYDGKSVLFEQTAFELQQSGERYTPFIVRIKDVTLRPIEEMLRYHIATWESIPAKELVILLDGCDEIAADRFLELITLVGEFTKKHSAVNLILSCRKLFYYHYGLAEKLRAFQTYELQPLSYAQTLTWLDEALGTGRRKTFLQLMASLDLESFLAYPFYLRNLAAWYATDRHHLPKNKMEMVDRFIDETLANSGGRTLSGGKQLAHVTVKHRSLLRRLALALQIAGLNAFPAESMQCLFNPDEMELLANSPVLGIEGQLWSFQRAIYQEQLAARALQERSSQQVIELVTVGKLIRKVKTKWIATVVAYLALFQENDPEQQKVIAMIRSDNAELLTQCDPTKFKPAFRLGVVWEIYERCARIGLRPMVTNERTLALFIRQDPAIMAYLFSVMESAVAVQVKVSCCQVIREIRLNAQQAAALRKIALKELPVLQHAYYGKLLIDHLSRYPTAGKSYYPLLIRRPDLLKSHDYRNGVYGYLNGMGLTDIHYQFGLDGLPVLFAHNDSTSYYGSEKNLENFLLATQSAENLAKLYQAISSHAWQEFYKHKAAETAEFLDRLCDLSVRLYQHHQQVFVAVYHFLTVFSRRYNRDAFLKLYAFFRQTQSNNLALLLYLNRLTHHSEIWNFADILTTKCYDTLMYYLEEGYISRSVVEAFISGLHISKCSEAASALQQLLDNCFGKRLEPQTYWTNQQVIRETREANDRQVIQSLAAFRKGLLDFFDVRQAAELTIAELYEEDEELTPRMQADSEFVRSFIRDCSGEDMASLEICLYRLADQQAFEWWRSQKLFHYPFNNLLADAPLLDILRDHYARELAKARFQNAYFIQHGKLHWWNKEVLLANIWKKFQFATADEYLLEMTWMETSGIRSFKQSLPNQPADLGHLLLACFQHSPQRLAQKILSNMRVGIEAEGVLLSHIGFCKALKITEAIELILEALLSGRISDYQQKAAIEVYLELGGEADQLLAFFESGSAQHDYVFLWLAAQLKIAYPELVEQQVLKVYSRPKQRPERRTELARFLAEMGNQTAFRFLINRLSFEKKSPYHIQTGTRIWNVHTPFALKLLAPVLYLIIDPVYEQPRFYETAGQFLLEVIFGLAAKGEEDLALVQDLLFKKAKILRSRYPQTHNHLVWYAERAAENFRDQPGKTLTMNELLQLLSHEYQKND